MKSKTIYNAPNTKAIQTELCLLDETASITDEPAWEPAQAEGTDLFEEEAKGEENTPTATSIWEND